jgi:hypothetical protein
LKSVKSIVQKKIGNFSFDSIETDDEEMAAKERRPELTFLSFGSISVTLMSSSLRRVETMFSS